MSWLWRELAEEVGGGGAAVHQEVAAGDEAAVRSQEVAAAAFGGDHTLPFFFIQATTAAILILAANTAYNGFPASASILAQHWTWLLRAHPPSAGPALWRRMHASRLINGTGAAMTALVLDIVTTIKFSPGAWIVLVAMPLLMGLKSHYDAVGRELQLNGDESVPPARNHAIVLVYTLHKPTMRAPPGKRSARPQRCVVGER